MPRKQLSEYRAKQLLSTDLGRDYDGVSVLTSQDGWQKTVRALDAGRTYVVKIDQATKGRFKKGLVRLNRTPKQLVPDITEMATQGYSSFIIEPYVVHESSDERYFALSRGSDGVTVAFSPHGGVDVEAQPEAIIHQIYHQGLALPDIGLPAPLLETIVRTFEDNYFSFLEVNPLVATKGGAPLLLDAAVEVDDAAEFFVDSRWSKADFRSHAGKALTSEERTVRELNEQSQASFNLEVLNPDGSLFLLLSGGGASVVVADEVKNLGHGELLANYGEYSGGPNREETKLYTEQVLSLLLKSSAKKKTLLIAGGVANFTDVKTTFAGVIDALREQEQKLKKQGIKVFVRRGGPNEVEGLAMMRDYLKQAGILGAVHGPELVLTDVVREALKVVKA